MRITYDQIPHSILDTLSVRERAIMEYRLGVEDSPDYPPHTLAETAERFGFGDKVNGIRVLESFVLSRMNHPSVSELGIPIHKRKNP